MYRSSPLRSTLNTNIITGSGMCKVCTGTRGKGVVTGSPTYLKKEALQEDVRLADKGFKYYDELVRDLTESFLAGEFSDANPDSIGSPSNALTVLVWKVWSLEKRRDLASPFDRRPEQDLAVTRKTSQAKFQLITNKQTNKNQTNMRTLCFLRWWGAL